MRRRLADLRNAIAAPQMPPYQIGITSDDGNRVAQLLARDAEGAAPMIQAIDITDIYSGRTADVYVRCGQVHVLLPFVGWADAHFGVSICPRNRVFHSAHTVASVCLQADDCARPCQMIARVPHLR